MIDLRPAEVPKPRQRYQWGYQYLGALGAKYDRQLFRASCRLIDHELPRKLATALDDCNLGERLAKAPVRIQDLPGAVESIAGGDVVMLKKRFSRRSLKCGPGTTKQG